MIRLQRVACSMSLFAVLVAAGAAFGAPSETVVTNGQPAVTCGHIADQLGVKLPRENAEQEFNVGVQFTGTLEDTLKITAFGIKRMHPGARVTVLRIAPDRVYVEADELLPPNKESVRLRMNPDGKLLPPSRV